MIRDKSGRPWLMPGDKCNIIVAIPVCEDLYLASVVGVPKAAAGWFEDADTINNIVKKLPKRAGVYRCEVELTSDEYEPDDRAGNFNEDDEPGFFCEFVVKRFRRIHIPLKGKV